MGYESLIFMICNLLEDGSIEVSTWKKVCIRKHFSLLHLIYPEKVSLLLIMKRIFFLTYNHSFPFTGMFLYLSL